MDPPPLISQRRGRVHAQQQRPGPRVPCRRAPSAPGRPAGEEARAVAESVHGRNRVVFLTGGTGLYIRAFLDGLIETGSVDRVLRDRLENEQQRAAEAGAPPLGRDGEVGE